MRKQAKFKVIMSLILGIGIIVAYRIYIIKMRPPEVNSVLEEYGKEVKFEYYNKSPSGIFYYFVFKNTEDNLSENQVKSANRIRKMIEEDTGKNEEFFYSNNNNDMTILFGTQDLSRRLIFNYSLDKSLDKTDKLLQVGVYGGICKLSDLACISDMSYLRFNGVIDDSNFLRKLKYLKHIDFCDIPEEKFEKMKKELSDSEIVIESVKKSL